MRFDEDELQTYVPVAGLPKPSRPSAEIVLIWLSRRGVGSDDDIVTVGGGLAILTGWTALPQEIAPHAPPDLVEETLIE